MKEDPEAYALSQMTPEQRELALKAKSAYSDPLAFGLSYAPAEYANQAAAGVSYL